MSIAFMSLRCEHCRFTILQLTMLRSYDTGVRDIRLMTKNTMFIFLKIYQVYIALKHEPIDPSFAISSVSAKAIEETLSTNKEYKHIRE